MINGIAIVGGNGSGKTTLCKKIAETLNYKYMDVEDYYFKKSDISYTNARTKEEVKKLLLKDMKKYKRFVFSSVSGNYGEEVTYLYDLIIYISVPLNIRIERIKKRSLDKFGKRVLKGRDMYKSEQEFLDFVSTRSLDKAHNWLKDVKCPIIYIDGTLSIEENMKKIKYIINL